MNAQLAASPMPPLSQWPAGLHDDVPPQIYHRRELGVVNNGAIKELLRTPAHYRAWVVGAEQPDTPALAFGRALHCLVLEPQHFAREYAEHPEFGDLRTKAAKEARDAWMAAHPDVELVASDDWQRMHAMRDAVMAHPIAGKLFTGGVAESTAIWTDAQHGLVCKARMDYYVASRGLVIDLKSTDDASEHGFAASIVRYHYHVQHAHYASAFQSLGHELRAFLFVAVEKSEPYAVAVHCIDADAEGRGMELRDRAMSRLNDCLQTDTWPSYEPTIHRLALPRWALND
jgi:exodeoxyribonuclease VIII